MPEDKNGSHNRRKMYKDEAKCIGFREALEESRARREAKPQPWFARKLAVGIVIAIWIYAYYVYVGRFIFEMIRPHRSSKALGTRAEGIGFLVAFNLLWLMLGWSYFTTIFTSPGYAEHHVKKEPRPDPTQQYSRPSWDSDEIERGVISGPRYVPQNPPSAAISPERARARSNPGDRETDTERTLSGPSSPRKIEGASVDMHSDVDSTPSPREARPADALPRVSPPKNATSKVATVAHPHQPPTTHGRENVTDPPPLTQPASAWFSRAPPQHGVLLPEYRYCSREGFVKPLRAHHCRSCGKCVLQYDHHCPWIGQCVGARNRRLFIIFLFWSSLTGIYIFVSLLVLNVSAMNRTDVAIDPPQIVLIALAGFFSIFTCVLFTSQLHLVFLNLTTVEHLSIRSQHERESAILSRQYSVFAFGARRRARKNWDQEWGRPGREGNIWWLGSAMRNFKSTFGDRKLCWFLPIGKDGNDGLSYPVNPRFDSKGRWRPRREWPRELR